MLIDWFTVGAQALNFLILVWLMKRFLYKPVLQAIDAREKRVAAELAEAAAKKTEAEKLKAELESQLANVDQQRAALLKKATDEAAVEGQRLIGVARKAADALTAKRKETLRADAQTLGQAIERRTKDEVFAIARKALADLATTSLEERLGEVFTRRLHDMGGKEKDALASALKAASNAAIVRSAFDLPPEERAKVQYAINVAISADVHLRFETAPDLVCGIELSTNGMKVGWSIKDYLSSLDRGVADLLKENAKAETKPDAKVEPTPEAKAKAETETKPESTPAATPDAETKPEATPQAKPKTESTPAAKPDAETKPEGTAEAKAKPKAPEATAQAKPESKAETESTPAAKPTPEAEPDATAEAIPEPKAAANVDAAPEAKPSATPGPKASPKPGASQPEAGKA
jgi:F-type H+-transporting ATPase subunit b